MKTYRIGVLGAVAAWIQCPCERCAAAIDRAVRGEPLVGHLRVLQGEQVLVEGVPRVARALQAEVHPVAVVRVGRREGGGRPGTEMTRPARAVLVLGYLAVLVGVLVVFGIVNFIVGRLLDSTGLTGPDRLLGAVFGVLRGAAIVTVRGGIGLNLSMTSHKAPMASSGAMSIVTAKQVHGDRVVGAGDVTASTEADGDGAG